MALCMLALRRKNVKVGKSTYIALPHGLVKGAESALVAGRRLILVDPLGKADLSELGDFLEKKIEPFFERRLREIEEAA